MLINCCTYQPTKLDSTIPNLVILHHIAAQTEFHYLEDQDPKNSSSKVTSLYRASFGKSHTGNNEALYNPGRKFGKAKGIVQDVTPGLTVRELFKGDGKMKSSTSYQKDFRDFFTYCKQPIETVPAEQDNGSDLLDFRAVKYRRWAEQ